MVRGLKKGAATKRIVQKVGAAIFFGRRHFFGGRRHFCFWAPPFLYSSVRWVTYYPTAIG
jgi:hypothetical protein